MFKRHKREALTLKRDLGLFDATLAGIGIIVGAGIYVLIGTAAGYAGNAVWLSFITAALVALLTGFSYAELSSIYTDDSGEYSYVDDNFGKRIAFVTGYLVMLSLVIGAAAVSLGFSGYLNSFLGISGPGTIVVTAVISIIAFSIINFIGIKQSMKLNVVFTVLSIVGLLAVIVISVFRPVQVDFFEIPGSFAGVFKAASLIFFAYIGFESVVKLSEETKNPARTIPLALLLSLAISTVFYVAVAFAAINLMGWEKLAASTAPLSDVVKFALGSNAGIAVSLIAMVSTGNTILLSLVAMSRMVYGMSKDYVRLGIFSKINAKTGTPTLAVVFAGIITILFVLIGNIETVAEITNFAVFAVFAVINLAVIKSRYKKHKKEMFHEPLNIGKFPVLALLGFFSVLFMLINLQVTVILLGVGMIASGFLAHKLIS